MPGFMDNVKKAVRELFGSYDDNRIEPAPAAPQLRLPTQSAAPARQPSYQQSLRAQRCVRLVRGMGPAVSYDDIESSAGAVLRKRTESVGAVLQKHANTKGLRGRVVVALDRSSSLRKGYQDGWIQILVERALACGFAYSTKGEITILPYDSKVHPEIVVNRHNFRNIVHDRIWKPGDHMGMTNMPAVLRHVREMAKTTDEPIILLFVTDGRPEYDGVTQAQAAENTLRLICELAGYPVIIKFMALVYNEFLDLLDNLERDRPGARLLDNVNAVVFDDNIGEDNHYHNVRDISDSKFAEAVLLEVPEIIDRQLDAGVLTAA